MPEHTDVVRSADSIIAGLDIHTVEQSRSARPTTEGDFELDHDVAGLVDSVTPYYVDNSAKTHYIAYRGSGFTKKEALDLVDRTARQLYRWYDADPEFKVLDNDGLNEFRETVARNVAFADYMRNFRLTMRRDSDLLRKAVEHPDELQVEDRRDLRSIRPQYTPAALAAVTQYMKGNDAAGSGDHNTIVNIIQAVAGEANLADRLNIFDAHKTKGKSNLLEANMEDYIETKAEVGNTTNPDEANSTEVEDAQETQDNPPPADSTPQQFEESLDGEETDW